MLPQTVTESPENAAATSAEAAPKRPVRVRDRQADKAAADKRFGMTVSMGSMVGSELDYVARQGRRLRFELERAVLDHHGEISLVAAAAIATASRWEMHGHAARRRFARDHEKLEPSEFLAFSKAVAEASERRDKAIERLGLPLVTAASDLSLMPYVPPQPPAEPTIS